MSRKCSKATKRVYGDTTPGTAAEDSIAPTPLRTAPRTMSHVPHRSHIQVVGEEAARLAPPTRASAVGVIIFITVVGGRTAAAGWGATFGWMTVSRGGAICSIVRL
jgi:hypothetical protein